MSVEYHLDEKVSCEWLMMSVHIHKGTGHNRADVPTRHTGPGQAESLSAMGGEKGKRGGSPETLTLCFSGKKYIKPQIYHFSQLRGINYIHIVV